MLMFGLISEIDRATFRVRVNFEEDDIVTAPIPVAVFSSKGNEDFDDLEINTPVACLMDHHCEHGVVIGCIYNDDNKPSRSAEGVRSIKFKDGSFAEYDSKNHIFTIQVGDNTGCTYQITPSGFLIKRQDETLKKLLSDLLTEIQKITVNTPSGTSAVPNNIAKFEEIIQRLPNLFTE
jgi:phage baseplate assembly protein gpV